MAEKAKEKKPGLFTRLIKYFRDSRGEFKKVVWPSRQQVLNNTGVVLAVVLVAGVFLFGLDYALGAIMRFILGLASGA
jgi:preprotein translocase, SecE subunit, bacterial